MQGGSAKSARNESKEGVQGVQGSARKEYKEGVQGVQGRRPPNGKGKERTEKEITDHKPG